MTCDEICHGIRIELNARKYHWILCQLFTVHGVYLFLLIYPLETIWRRSSRLVTRTKELNICSGWDVGQHDGLMKVMICDISTVYYHQMLRTCDVACMLGPERWWTMFMKGKVRGNPDGGLHWYWRANCSQYINIGVKDSSNHLVAGSLWNVLQDSWSHTTSPGKVID